MSKSPLEQLCHDIKGSMTVIRGNIELAQELLKTAPEWPGKAKLLERLGRIAAASDKALASVHQVAPPAGL